MYGLKQASRQSFSKLTSVLLAIGYVHFTAVLVYVDDILVTGTNASHITALKLFLDNNFNIKDFGLIKYYLGIEVLHTKAGLFLNQRKYALDLIQNVGLLEAKLLSIPMDTNKRLKSDEGDLLEYASFYRRIVGKLMYLTITSLPQFCCSST